jgi:hypothetical protein
MSAIRVPSPGFDMASDDGPIGVSQVSRSVHEQWQQAQRHFTAPVTRATIAQKVEDLATTWREERGPSSSYTDLVLSPAYQRIIGLGPKAVPALLVELAIRPDHWFWALYVLTGVDPIPDDAAGDFRAMREAWIRWGEEQGLLD